MSLEESKADPGLFSVLTGERNPRNIPTAVFVVRRRAAGRSTPAWRPPDCRPSSCLARTTWRASSRGTGARWRMRCRSFRSCTGLCGGAPRAGGTSPPRPRGGSAVPLRADPAHHTPRPRSKYKLMEASFAQNKSVVKAKIPEIDRSLRAVQFLLSKREEGAEDVTSHYSLAESVFAGASIDVTGTVCLWLGVRCCGTPHFGAPSASRTSPAPPRPAHRRTPWWSTRMTRRRPCWRAT